MALIHAKRGAGPDGGHGLVGVNYKGDKVSFLHAQDVGPIAEMCKEARKDPAKGFTKGRTMQRIASIPELVFFAHPELVGEHGALNLKELRKFLKTPEGSMYVATSGNI
jgi:hypothetical protein